MDRLVINGGRNLAGEVQIGVAKNAALPAMAAALLTEEEVRLPGVPAFKDVETMADILRGLGSEVELGQDAVSIRANDPGRCEAPYEFVRRMRASFFVLGPLLAKRKRARVSLPGGCAIGARPINYHLNGLAAMGARIEIRGGYVEAAADRLCGSAITFESPSMGATENVMMAASLAEGVTVISNAAREPEVADLAGLLNRMGAKIGGAGTDTVTVEGVRELRGAEHRPIPDRIEAGTYLIMSALTGCGLRVKGARREHLQSLEGRLYDAGVSIREDSVGLRVACASSVRASDIVTLPYPGFPTDMQAQWIALMAVADGTTVVRETVFENRFQHVPELVRMGARIAVKGGTAVIQGVNSLKGAPVMVSDLRAGAALVLAGLAATGETVVHRVYHLDRGYAGLVEKLKAVGAHVERVPGPSV
jgi:UDP-N-acetylglucosamine 1-carboxyvinyltransferase